MLVAGGWLAWQGPPAVPTLIPTAHVGLLPVTNTPRPIPTTATPWPSPSPNPSPTSSPTPVPPTAIPTETPAVSPTPSLTPLPTALALALTPGQPQPYLARFRLVTYYGSPLGPDLGILGANPRPVMLQELRGVVAQYQTLSPDRYVLPTFHIVSTVADAYPGDYGTYNHWMSMETLSDWVTAAEEAGVAVVLDIQPGHASIPYEFKRIKEFLYKPHVHLALDSEFTMEGDQVPGRNLGQIYASQINPIQAELNVIAQETGLNKVFIIHQFETSMVRGKEFIEDYPYVELVFDADGFGGPQAKTRDYSQYVGEPAFEYGGLKLFYNWDSPLLTPAEVMSLEPQPAVIVYQ